MHIVVGMSGGVDSSVAAYLLHKEGHKITGLFMKNWNEDDYLSHCAATQDEADARTVCDRLGIALHTVNFAQQYWDNVFEYFLSEYKNNRTPNPDILCNKEIKFKTFLDHALDLGADAIATGHYAQIKLQSGKYELWCGVDDNKDQSYFLYQLNQHQLKHALFPIGSYYKSKIREIARTQGFITHNKKDSTGICFIGEKRFNDFLSQYLPAKPGRIESPEGEILGEHQGLMYYTIGQRKGLGLGGKADSVEKPWYVADKDAASNTLIVVQGSNHPKLFKQRLKCQQVHWISPPGPSSALMCLAKIRYRQAPQACTINIAENTDELIVDFLEPQRAITPGQAIVFYNQKHCLGGATIVE